MPSAMVTFNGRITLPTDVRRQLGLRTGDSIEFVELGNGRFAIAPRTSSDARSGDPAVSHLSGWVPSLDLSDVENEPRFLEADEFVH